MNETIRGLYARKSIREYEDRPISGEAREAILKAAFMAPSAGNQQLYTIIDVQDQTKKEALAESCDHQPFIAKAKLVLVFCADCKKWYDAFLAEDCNPRLPGVGDLMLAVTDTAIAAQNAVTAAESLGIGSCYIGDIMENAEQQREILGLPKYVFPAVMVVFGYPTEKQKSLKKPGRVESKHVVHVDSYRCMESDELREMFDYKKGSMAYDDWVKAFCNRKYNSDFSREMTRSVKAYLDEFEYPVTD